MNNEGAATKKLRLETLAVHGGYGGDQEAGAVVPPLYLTTTFERKESGETGAYIYNRLDNPNRKALEAKLAALEGAADAVAYSSGQAATMAVIESVLEPDAHLIIADDCYHGTRSLLDKVMKRWRLSYTEVDMSDPANVAGAIRPGTRLIWVETPSNPMLKIADLEAIAGIARSRNILLGCDNTWATPFFQHPLELGADIVMHSTTKYLGGHSDILGGCVMVREKGVLLERLRDFQQVGGAVPSPFDCWLLYRSLATFPMRMRVHAANAAELAEFLNGHPSIERVYFPGLPGHPNHEVAKRQMPGGFGGMLSIQVRGGREEAMRLAGRLNIVRHATSLGGVESLIEHRRSVEGASPKSPDNLLRVSVGVEHIDDLLEDFRQALT